MGTSQLPAPFEPNPTLLRPPLPSQCPTESREDILPHPVSAMLCTLHFTVYASMQIFQFVSLAYIIFQCEVIFVGTLLFSLCTTIYLVW